LSLLLRTSAVFLTTQSAIRSPRGANSSVLRVEVQLRSQNTQQNTTPTRPMRRFRGLIILCSKKTKQKQSNCGISLFFFVSFSVFPFFFSLSLLSFEKRPKSGGRALTFSQRGLAGREQAINHQHNITSQRDKKVQNTSRHLEQGEKAQSVLSSDMAVDHIGTHPHRRLSFDPTHSPQPNPYFPDSFLRSVCLPFFFLFIMTFSSFLFQKTKKITKKNQGKTEQTMGMKALSSVSFHSTICAAESV